MSYKSFTRNLPLNLNTRQLDKLKKHSNKTGLRFDENKLSQVYSFWLETMAIATHVDKYNKPINQTRIIDKVLLEDAPDLMFVDTDAMRRRLDKFFQFGFINNMNKLHLFSHSPYGWYLQDWDHFAMKFSYIQFRIMPWLLAKEDDPWPEPHPLIQACKALELPYDHIKARFLWVKTAGIGPAKLNEGRGDQLNFSKVLVNLLLTNAEYFVKEATPGASRQEYEFFEKMVASTEMVEDSIMSSLSDLTPEEETVFLTQHEDENVRELASIEFKKLKKSIR